MIFILQVGVYSTSLVLAVYYVVPITHTYTVSVTATSYVSVTYVR